MIYHSYVALQHATGIYYVLPRLGMMNSLKDMNVCKFDRALAEREILRQSGWQGGPFARVIKSPRFGRTW